MKIGVNIVPLVLALALWGFNLWRRGFFSSATSSLERKTYILRNFIWLASIVIVAWPLHNYRERLGDSAYVIAALFILGLLFLLGILASKTLAKRHRSQP